jgi:hypothetical protein
MRRITLFGVFLCACGGGSSGVEDAGRDAQSARLDGGRDAGRDAGPRDASSEPDAHAESDAQAESDAAVETDAGIDCSKIGCGAPIVCGTECTAPCGCCDCGAGETIEIDGSRYVCAGGCYVLADGGGEGEVCITHEDCDGDLRCCYPCGIPDCANICTVPCDPREPFCIGGCPMFI